MTIMAGTDTLLRVCELAGVQTSFEDVWGTTHTASEAALRATLQALGIAADDESLPASEAALQQAGHTEMLPPVLVVPVGSPHWALPLRLIGEPAPLAWRIDEEGGASRGGALRGDALQSGAQHRGIAVPQWSAPPPENPREPRTAQLALPVTLPAGYHRLSIEGWPGSTLLIAAPEQCHLPPGLAAGARLWGPSVQLYSLRSARNWGIGDFSDLRHTVETWARKGAALVGVNPLHALFAHNPLHSSPYSPSSRRHLNVLYLDVETIDDLAECEPALERLASPAFQSRLAELRAAPLVDYAGVAAAKDEVLRLLHASFRQRHQAVGTARAEDFLRFRTERGAALREHAAFEALQAHFHADDVSIWGWPVWPAEYRDPAAPAVARWLAEHAEQVDYHEYLQWQADRQLAAVSRRCRELGMAVGLYLDLAVAVDRAGSDTWTHSDAHAEGASVGAPPDQLNLAGQDWGLVPLHPRRSRRSGHRLFAETLRAVMRHAGALRIDHVMNLMRLYWVPQTMKPTDGAYVRYPLHELLAIVALESWRARCLVIGEDLGTVAGEMRAAMAQRLILSYRLLYFERDAAGDFLPPAAYPRNALVAVGTHDLPTLAGWWSGHDLALRRALGEASGAGFDETEIAARAQDRLRLLAALQRAALLPVDADLASIAAQPLAPSLAQAVHVWLARSPARLMALQIEDALGVIEQSNLPGTTDQHPNWRRKLPVSVEDIAADECVDALAGAVTVARTDQAGTELRTAVIPRATYRLQLHREFGFDSAARIVPYLAALGVSHVYCSPIQRARPGSRHGYDIVAHDEINPELGGEAGFERLCAALRAYGMGFLLDLVPNHMGVLGSDNPWWNDVLENGEASPFAHYFDIDWQPANASLDGKVLLPVLGDHYGAVLDRGELSLALHDGRVVLRYFEHRFPIDLRCLVPLLARAANAVEMASVEAASALAVLARELQRLPPRAAPPDPALVHRYDELRRRLTDAMRQEAARQAIEQELAGINAGPAHDELHALHEQQAYRLAYWRTAADEVNYRRFFDVNDLAGLRMEDPEVFEATHRRVLDLLAAGQVDGLRIDHPDGLRDPRQYFERLQQAYAQRLNLPGSADARPGRPPVGRPPVGRPPVGRPLYLVIEKITASHEEVPRDWAIHGTTGYRFAMVAGGVLIDTNAEAALERLWREFTDLRKRFDQIAYEGKRLVMRQALSAELTRLTSVLARIAQADRHTRDYTFNTLRGALAEVVAGMPVYRSYIVAQASEQDRRHLDRALAHARRRWQSPDASVFDFIRRVLLPEALPPGVPPAAASEFAARFQQFCAPVAAKGVEDTAFYRYGRLLALNEVGGDPSVFGITPRAFHGASADRAEYWPHTMLTTSTHDSKRSEDVRSRISVLSEMPAAWRLAVRRLHRMTRSYRSESDGTPLPSAADEYLLYQTLLGTLPEGVLDEASLRSYRERIEAYMLKAAREAKLCTSWTAPDAQYEGALSEFVNGVLSRPEPNPLLRMLRGQAGLAAWFGALNGLSLTLMKFTSPGVPDLYQGNEMIELNLVDPDNRRAVDFDLRSRELGRLIDLWCQPRRIPALDVLCRRLTDGRLKLWFTWRLLDLRRRIPSLFADGDYTPLGVNGVRAEHVLAYTRSHAGTTLIVIAGRLFARLSARARRLPLGEPAWGDTTVELPGKLIAGGEQSMPGSAVIACNVLTGESLTIDEGRIPLAQAFAHLPGAALLIDQRSNEPRRQ